MIEPWHTPILVMAGIILLEYVVVTTLPQVDMAWSRRLRKWLFKLRGAVVWTLVLMLITGAVVALFDLDVAGTLVGIIGGLASVFAFLNLIHNERRPGGP